MHERGIDVHSLLIIRNGQVLADATFYPYDGRTVHEVASVTKSMMTTLIGIAADQGELKLDDSMLSFFPDRTVANRDARKEKITVRHLASMSSGLDCTAEGDEQTLREMRAARTGCSSPLTAGALGARRAFRLLQPRYPPALAYLAASHRHDCPGLCPPLSV